MYSGRGSSAGGGFLAALEGLGSGTTWSISSEVRLRGIVAIWQLFGAYEAWISQNFGVAG